MDIAVLGTGSVGGVLGSRWAEIGHRVIFGTRNVNSEKVTHLVNKAGDNATAATVAEACAAADVVVLAVPWNAARSTIETAGDLTGKLLIDCTNPIAPGLQLAIGLTTSGGEQVAQWAGDARVVKAFNTVTWETMADPIFGGEAALMLICGDEEGAKAVVSELANSLGFEAVDLGALETARFLEPFAMASIHLVVMQGYGRDFAFKLIRR